ncbi:DUF6069 family protein [Haliscomenobacter sp.]|uniref:DUF6069 family protein n=1 Tax=Haliscomenobacter sp. TaxID=2717303 RepID=UPI003BAD7D38
MSSIEKIAAKKLLWVAPLAGAIAAGINSVLFLIGSAIGLVDESVLVPGMNTPITIGPVIMSSFIPSLIAGLVLGVMNYFLNKPFKVFRVVALVLLILSFANPFMGIPGIPLGMGLWLNVMHVVVAGTVVYCFGRFTAKA